MADDPSKQVEIEVALRDSASSVLKDISKEIDNISRKLVETGRKGSDAFEKIKRGADESGVGTRGAGSQVSGLGKSMGELSKYLIGPIGLAAAFTAVARSLGHFAAQRVQLQGLAEDIGLTTEQFSKFDQVLNLKGIESKDARKQIITALAGQYKDIEMRGTYSEAFDKLKQLNDPQFEANIKQLTGVGDIWGAITEGFRKYEQLRKDDPALARYMATEILGITPAIANDFLEMTKGVKSVYQTNTAEMKKAVEEQETFMNEINSGVAYAADKTVQALNSLKKTYDDFFSGKLPTEGAPAAPAQGVTPPAGPSGSSTFKDRFPEPGAFGPQKQSLLQGGDGAGLPAGATPIMYTKVSSTLNDMKNTEKETSRTWKEISSILSDLLSMPDFTGGAATGGLTFRPGIRSAGQGRPSVGGRPDATGGPPAQATPGGPAAKDSGYNYYQKRGVAPLALDKMTRVQTPFGVVVAHPDAAADIAGFTNELKESGAPIKSLGSYSYRQKRWGGGLSSHAFGTAWDVNDATEFSPEMKAWIRANPEKWASIKERWNIGQPLTAGVGVGGKDDPHLEWRGPHGSKLTTPPIPQPQSSTGPQSSLVRRPAAGSGRASTFDDRVTASGMSPNIPGIALPDKSTLGQRFIITDPNTGREIVAVQSDVGPAAWTGRSIDINRPLREQFGYKTEGAFPTDKGTWKWRPEADAARTKTDQALSQDSPVNLRTGKVSATVDFGAMAKAEEAKMPFLKLKMPSGSQYGTARTSTLVPGDSDYSTWGG